MAPTQTYRIRLVGQLRRLWKIRDEAKLAQNAIAELDLVSVSFLDWSLIYLEKAIRELEQLQRIAAYEESRRGGK